MGRCSSILRQRLWFFGIAAFRAALVLSVLISIAAARPRGGEAAVRVEGVPDWLEASARRSMEVVYEHIPASEPAAVKEELLRVVADRLLLGYSVSSVTFAGGDVAIRLAVTKSPPDWTVAVAAPSLSQPVDGWFAADAGGLDGEIASLLTGVPVEALAWGDIDLKAEVDRLSSGRLPGWRAALMARGTISGGVILDVSFMPEQPLTLAVSTRINSSSIPAILHSGLRDDLTKGFAPVIGIPAAWLDKHSGDMESLGRDILTGESLVKVSQAEPVVTAETGVVSNVGVGLESRRYAARLWMSVYAVAEGRYPEVGAHLGRRIQLLPHWDMELYGELILQLDDWELEKRLGMRWPLWRNVWVGGEGSDRDDLWWGMVDLESWARRPYAWLRYSEEDDFNAALGYHFNDYISIELHYDSRYEDKLNVRALLNL